MRTSYNWKYALTPNQRGVCSIRTGLAIKLNGSIAQLVEQSTVNRCVSGSSPGGAAMGYGVTVTHWTLTPKL